MTHRFTLYKDEAGEWRWNLKAENNRIIATSGEGYHNRGDALEAIHLVRGGARQANIVDEDGETVNWPPESEDVPDPVEVPEEEQ